MKVLKIINLCFLIPIALICVFTLVDTITNGIRTSLSDDLMISILIGTSCFSSIFFIIKSFKVINTSIIDESDLLDDKMVTVKTPKVHSLLWVGHLITGLGLVVFACIGIYYLLKNGITLNSIFERQRIWIVSALLLLGSSMLIDEWKTKKVSERNKKLSS